MSLGIARTEPRGPADDVTAGGHGGRGALPRCRCARPSRLARCPFTKSTVSRNIDLRTRAYRLEHLSADAANPLKP